MKRIFIFFILCALLILFASKTLAFDLKIKNNQWIKISDVCSIKKIRITRLPDKSSFNLFLIRFNPKRTKVKILTASQFSKKICDVSFLARKNHAFCVINGGFFDSNYNPLGVLVTDGKILQYMPEGGYFSVFCIKHGRPRIIHMKNFTYDGATEALQCSPRLIANGINTRGVYGLNTIDRRSGIGLDAKGNIIIYATDTTLGGLSFAELRNIFRLPDINLKTVLSLDGGGSTQLYFKLKNKSIDINGFENIPVGIGFFLK